VTRVIVVAAILVAIMTRAAPPPTAQTIAFVVALRTFESQSVALADQAAAQSSAPALRRTAATLAMDGNSVSAALWAWLDHDHVPGSERLPAPSAGAIGASPTAGLRHACALVTADELGRLAVMTGPAFDELFVRDWVAHADAAFNALDEATALRTVVQHAELLLRRDVSMLAANWAVGGSRG
jgi:hypothetical protein